MNEYSRTPVHWGSHGERKGKQRKIRKGNGRRGDGGEEWKGVDFGPLYKIPVHRRA